MAVFGFDCVSQNQREGVIKSVYFQLLQASQRHPQTDPPFPREWESWESCCRRVSAREGTSVDPPASRGVAGRGQLGGSGWWCTATAAQSC